MDPFQITPFRCDIPWFSGTDSQTNGIVLLHDLCPGDIFPYLCISSEFNTFFNQQRQSPVDHLFGQFEVRNAISEQAARAVIFLEDGDRMSFPVQLLGSSQSSRTGADNSYFLASPPLRRMGFDHPFPSSLP